MNSIAISSELFAWYVAIMVVIGIPSLFSGFYVSEHKDLTRKDRLRVWQLMTLLGMTALALWAKYFVQPNGKDLFLEQTPMWIMVCVGVALSIALQLFIHSLDRRQRTLRARAIAAARRP